MSAWLDCFLAELWPLRMSFSVELIIAELMFIIVQPKRLRFPLRVIVGLFFYCMLCWTLPFIANGWFVLFRVLWQFGMSILFLYFVLDCPLKCTLFIALIAYALQNFAYNLSGFVTSLLALDSGTLPHSFVAFFLFVLTYAVGYFLIVQRFSQNDNIYTNNVTSFLLAAATLVITCSKSLLRSLYVVTDQQLLLLFNTFCVTLVLFMLFGTLWRGRIAEEKRIIEELLRAEENKRTMWQENIDIINMKCHDLRYHLDEFRKANVDIEHAQFFAEVAKSIDIYDNMPDTGIPALNALLAEKLLYCDANGIDISYIIDKSAIEQMSASDIYSLFGNAIENAIQSVEKEETGKRTISISAQVKGGFCQILFANYCAKQPLMRDGLPVTSKDNTLHGFGLRSIRYIVEKHGGSMLIDYYDHIFTLSLLLPQAGGTKT